MDTSGEEVYKMLNYPNEDVRQAAVGAMTQFVISLAKISAPEASEGDHRYHSNLGCDMDFIGQKEHA